MSGAGGYGNPLHRIPIAYYGTSRKELSRRTRRASYGVAIQDGLIDQKATAELRQGKLAENPFQTQKNLKLSEKPGNVHL